MSMKIKFKLFVLVMIVVVLIPIYANAQFSLSGELRPRAEYRHGFKSPATEKMGAAAFISQRTRLNLNYKKDNLKVGISLQDVRVWGDVPQLNLSDNSFSLHEAWGEYYFTPNFSFKAGRMELVYDDSRMLGNVDWAQQGRSHDIGLLKFEDEKWKLHIGFAFNQNKELFDNKIYTVPGNYKSMQLVWLNRKWEDLKISFLFLNNGKQNTELNNVITSYKIRFSQTIGLTGTYKVRNLSLNGSVYKQVGKEQPVINIDAMMLALNAQLVLKEHFSITPVFEYLSGTSQIDAANPNFNTTHSFNPFYGTNHKFNGNMDYYFVGNHINSVGLQDIFLKTGYNKNKISAGIDFHLFSAAADIMDPVNPTKVMARNLGQELDFYAGFKFTPEVTLNLGYSQYFASESTIALKGGNKNETSNWAWASISFKPEFLNSAK